MTVLITGARGAIGTRLVRRLHALGVDMRAASRAPELLDVPPGVSVPALDLADPTAIRSVSDGVFTVFLYAEPAVVDALLAGASAAGVERVALLSSSSRRVPLNADLAAFRSTRSIEAFSAAPTPARP